MRALALASLLALLASMPAMAGTACRKRAVAPEEFARAASVAVATYAELERHDAPVALVARVGSDVSRYGLRYSHVGFAVRDHADGRWTVVHLLNQCGTDRSALYAEGLANFYLDDLVSFDTKIVWLQPEQARRLAQELESPAIGALHWPRYSVIARPDSPDYQNSTSWALEVLVDALAPPPRPHDRASVQAQERMLGFRTDYLDIPYARRLAGALFAANASFTDHPLATRLSGRYPVVTVRAIFRLARAQGWVAAEQALGPDATIPGD